MSDETIGDTCAFRDCSNMPEGRAEYCQQHIGDAEIVSQLGAVIQRLDRLTDTVEDLAAVLKTRVP